MEEYTHKAHKIAYALERKLSKPITVRRMPLGKRCIAFEFSDGKKSVGYGQAFLDDSLAALATRIMNELAGAAHGNPKSNVGRKGKDI
jgi:hypothetical protein